MVKKKENLFVRAALTILLNPEIAEYKRSKILQFLLYFWGAIAFLIEAACIVSGVLQDWVFYLIVVMIPIHIF